MADRQRARTMAREMKVVFLGATAVGKTALVSGLVGGLYPETHFPTIEDRYHRQFTCGGIKRMVEIIDTSGAPEFAAVTNLQIISGDAFVVVYSVESRSSFNQAKRLLRDLCAMKTGDCRDAASVPIVIVANQVDNEAGSREVSFQEGCALAKIYGQSSVLEASALRGDNVPRVMGRVMERVCKGASAKRKPSVVRRLSKKASQKWRRSVAF